MNEPLDPNDFVITRKRKKYKFAKFANAPNCYEFDEYISRTHSSDMVDVVEVGAGTGLFCVELATRHPEQRFVALDVKADRLQKGAYAALERGLANIEFVRARADQLDQLFRPHSLSVVWLTFPDPYPRARSAGRRLTHPHFLATYQTLLKHAASTQQPGSLCLKHDNADFFAWSLEQLVASNWRLAELSFDLHASDLAEEYKLLTTYEKRWLDEQRLTQFVRAVAA
ncbi:hypothetical protein CR983_00630 [Candidatus Saccharibacteria bacterium]|nr:MAG: hypothetical protein CR983_00630 [Candidatus Saccharibacteria bacterium]